MESLRRLRWRNTVSESCVRYRHRHMLSVKLLCLFKTRIFLDTQQCNSRHLGNFKVKEGWVRGIYLSLGLDNS